MWRPTLRKWINHTLPMILILLLLLCLLLSSCADDTPAPLTEKNIEEMLVPALIGSDPSEGSTITLTPDRQITLTLTFKKPVSSVTVNGKPAKISDTLNTQAIFKGDLGGSGDLLVKWESPQGTSQKTLIFSLKSADNDKVHLDDNSETLVTLADVQQKVFNQSCVFSSCHSGLGRRGNLVLEPEKSYSNLVNVPAENEVAKAAGKLRVVPGNPEQSFLIQKLTRPGPGEGELMPYATEGLPEDKIQLVRKWIEDGVKPSPNPSSDTTPPKVASSSPKDDESGVDPAKVTKITVTFDEDVASVASVKLAAVGGEALQVKGEAKGKDVEVNFLGGAKIANETKYVLTGKAKDASGNEGDFKITFETEKKM